MGFLAHLIENQASTGAAAAAALQGGNTSTYWHHCLLFVDHLNDVITETYLKDWFIRQGVMVEDVSLNPPLTGRRYTYGLIKCRDADGVRFAVEHLNGLEVIEGRGKIILKKAF